MAMSFRNMYTQKDPLIVVATALSVSNSNSGGNWGLKQGRYKCFRQEYESSFAPDGEGTPLRSAGVGPASPL